MINSQTLTLNSVLSLWLFHCVSPLWLTCSFKHPLLDVSSNNYICWKSEIWIWQGPWKWFMSKSILSANPEPGANCNSLLEMTSYTPNNQQHTEHVPSPLYLPHVTTDTSVCVCVCETEKVFITGQESVQLFFFIDSTAGRYVYQEPPEPKIIKCCEADWNVAEASGPKAEESAQKHKGLLGRPRADWDPKLSW